MKNYFMIAHKKGFTLAEIIIVLGILGILIAALFPAYTNYISRWRDATRLTDIDQLAKAHGTYFNDNEKYPNHDLGCVNQAAISKYTNDKIIQDPLGGYSNGCNTLRHYGYASWSFAFNPNTFSLLAIMEQPNGGNYIGALDGFTGSLTVAAYNSGLTSTVKGAWPYFIRIP
jgi:prepilin-type N-terminal cleavage/methylation domain-containing protein